MRWAWRISGETGCVLDVVTSDMDRVGGWWTFCSMRIFGIFHDGDDGWRGWSVASLQFVVRVSLKESNRQVTSGPGMYLAI